MQTYTDTHAYYLHTQTHIHILQINSSLLILYLVAHLPNELRSHGPNFKT